MPTGAASGIGAACAHALAASGAQVLSVDISPEALEKQAAEVMVTETAIKRLVEPGEVADAVLYLCSPSASFVNGTSLVLDGGWSAR